MSEADRPSSELFHADGRLNIGLFSASATRTLRAGLEMARQTQWDSLRSPHLFMGLLKEPDAFLKDWEEQAELDFQKLLEFFQQTFREPDGPPEPKLALHREFFSDNLLRLLRVACERAGEHGRERITTADLLLSLLTSSPSVVAECLEQAEMPTEQLAGLAEQVEGSMSSDE